jgi:hypothetical protein
MHSPRRNWILNAVIPLLAENHQSINDKLGISTTGCAFILAAQCINNGLQE